MGHHLCLPKVTICSAISCVVRGTASISYYGSGFHGIVNFIGLENVFIQNVNVIKTDLSLTKT